MKLVFTTEKSVKGTRVLMFDVEADKKAKKNIRSRYVDMNAKEHCSITDEPRIKIIKGKKYLDYGK